MTIHIQNLMVATDFSEASEAAMSYAFRLARALQARLDIIHVVPEDDVQLLTAMSDRLQSDITAETLREVLYADADKRLATIIEKANAKERVREPASLSACLTCCPSSAHPVLIFNLSPKVQSEKQPLVGGIWAENAAG